jgi:hypothetical protein
MIKGLSCNATRSVIETRAHVPCPASLKWYCEGYALGIYEPDHLAKRGIDAVNTYTGFKVQLRSSAVCVYNEKSNS